MTEESFILLNLKEDKTKDLAKVMNSSSCRKILDFLTKSKSATETEISEKLQLPISTTHYNLDLLKKAGLVSAKEYHYSKKGKEVNHYSLANKFIIISPDTQKEGFIDKLKTILPLGIFAAIATFAIASYEWISHNTFMGKQDMAMEATMFKSQEMTAQSIVQTTQSEPNVALWFLAGSTFMILVILILKLIRK